MYLMILTGKHNLVPEVFLKKTLAASALFGVFTQSIKV